MLFDMTPLHDIGQPFGRLRPTHVLVELPSMPFTVTMRLEVKIMWVLRQVFSFARHYLGEDTQQPDY